MAVRQGAVLTDRDGRLRVYLVEEFPQRGPEGKADVQLSHGRSVAPRPGLEPGTCGLTVRRSTS